MMKALGRQREGVEKVMGSVMTKRGRGRALEEREGD